MFLMKLSTAATIEVGPALDSAGAEYTGLVIGDLRLVKAGTGAAMAASATLTHVANGHYTLVFTTSNTDTLGTLTVSCHKSTYQMPRVLMQVVPVKVYDSIVAGSDNLEVDAIQLLGTAFANPTTAGLMDVNAKQFGGATVNATTSVTIPASSTLATTTGAVGSVTGSVLSVTNAVGSVTGNVGGNVTGSVGSVVGAVGSVTGLTVANLDTTVSSRASQTSLDTLDDLVDTEVGAIKTKTDQLTFTIENQIDANSLTIGANAITASALATDAVNEIQSGLATPTNITAATGITVSSIGADVITASALATDAVNEIVDQVWDEVISGHATAGSTGAALSAAGAAGDPWSTALPGSYGAGTAGKIVGDNVNATISSRASQTSLDTLDDLVDTEVGAIKTKTDQLTFTVANQIDANSLTNGGLSASATRSAIGLATANLDTQIGTLATPTNITAGTITTVTNLTNAATSGDLTATMKSSVTTAVPTVSQTADQVWDELLSGHTTSGSTGAGLTSAASAGDPWSTLIPASYGAGTAGKILGDNVNATISSRASQTSLDTLDDYVDTEVAAIKTQTDKLTFTVANQVDANSLTNGGLSASATRSAIGLASANLDTQIGTLATPTNITAGTITTVTNLTNAPTSGDLTATMKSSVTSAVPTVVQIQNGLATPTNITAGTITTVTNLTNAATAGDLTATMKSSVTAAVPTAAQNFAAVLTTALTESYAADNTAPTLAQAIMLIQQSLHEFAISSTTRTVKKLDGSTTAATFTLDSATAPTSTTRAT